MRILELYAERKKIILMKELYAHIIIQIDKTENDNNKRLDKKTRIQNKE